MLFWERMNQFKMPCCLKWHESWKINVITLLSVHNKKYFTGANKEACLSQVRILFTVNFIGHFETNTVYP